MPNYITTLIEMANWASQRFFLAQILKELWL